MSPNFYQFHPADTYELTEDCHHYESIHETPWDIRKYFSQRYLIFEFYDDGIYLTDDAWFGVTPEPVAKQIAEDMNSTDGRKRILIDAFAGAGGNSIAFALSGRWDRIISIERDASTLACAQNNAHVYGVDPSLIAWVHGDSFEFLDALFHQPEQVHPDLRASTSDSVIFASPPWGGPGYSTDQVFDLSTMRPYSLAELHSSYQPLDHALFLPRTSDLRQIAELVPDHQKAEVVQYCMKGASKAIVAYLRGDGGSTPSQRKKLRKRDSLTDTA